MFEFLVACAAVVFAVFCVAWVAKIVLAVVMLPINLGLFLINGLLVLLCLGPVVIVSIGIASLVPLVLLMILGLPVLIVVGCIVLLVKLFT